MLFASPYRPPAWYTPLNMEEEMESLHYMDMDRPLHRLMFRHSELMGFYLIKMELENWASNKGLYLIQYCCCIN